MIDQKFKEPSKNRVRIGKRLVSKKQLRNRIELAQKNKK
jgi:hypothetical protein